MPARRQPISGSDSNAALRNQRVINAIEKRANQADAVLGPCLSAFKMQFESRGTYQSSALLENLTRYFVEANDETQRLIEAKMKKKWSKPEDTARIPRSVANSIRRSAGTNYQSLVSYALARYLHETKSEWFVEYPVPKEFRKALTIVFTGGLPPETIEEASEQVVCDDIADTGESQGEQEIPTNVTVQPDVDVLLRNAAWQAGEGKLEPIVLLSVKTSLVDRAGMAARWKIYFDLATRPCPHQDKEGCEYHQISPVMENANHYDILHGIVTANIYKINYHDVRYRKGELASGQTRSNTYMFDLKLTTRNDGEAITPRDWRQFQYITEVLSHRSANYNLPA